VQWSKDPSRKSVVAVDRLRPYFHDFVINPPANFDANPSDPQIEHCELPRNDNPGVPLVDFETHPIRTRRLEPGSEQNNETDEESDEEHTPLLDPNNDREDDRPNDGDHGLNEDTSDEDYVDSSDSEESESHEESMNDEVRPAQGDEGQEFGPPPVSPAGARRAPAGATAPRDSQPKQTLHKVQQRVGNLPEYWQPDPDSARSRRLRARLSALT